MVIAFAVPGPVSHACRPRQCQWRPRVAIRPNNGHSTGPRAPHARALRHATSSTSTPVRVLVTASSASAWVTSHEAASTSTCHQSVQPAYTFPPRCRAHHRTALGLVSPRAPPVRAASHAWAQTHMTAPLMELTDCNSCVITDAYDIPLQNSRE